MGWTAEAGSADCSTRCEDVGGTATPSYAHANHRGDVVGRYDGSGNAEFAATYSSDGQLQGGGSPDSIPDGLGLNTKEHDGSGLLIYYGHRYYDPEAGVWISRDPLGYADGPNLYAFVHQNAWNEVDPDGRLAGAVIGGALAGFTIGVGIDVALQFVEAKLRGQSFSWDINRSLAMGAAGAVSGGLFGLTTPLVGGIAQAQLNGIRALAGFAGGGLGGGVYQGSMNVMNGGEFFQSNTYQAAGWGAIMGFGVQVALDKLGPALMPALRPVGSAFSATKSMSLGILRKLGRSFDRLAARSVMLGDIARIRSGKISSSVGTMISKIGRGYLHRRGLELFYRGHNTPLASGEHIKSALEREGTRGASRRYLRDHVSKSVSRDELASATAMMNDQRLSYAMFGPHLDGTRAGGVGIPLTTRLETALKSDFSGGSGAQIYAILLRSSRAVKARGWDSLKYEQEYVAFHKIHRGRIVGTIEPFQVQQ